MFLSSKTTPGKKYPPHFSTKSLLPHHPLLLSRQVFPDVQQGEIKLSKPFAIFRGEDGVGGWESAGSCQGFFFFGNSKDDRNINMGFF
jgi:hypothetical protein